MIRRALVATTVALAMTAAACSGDDDDVSSDSTATSAGATTVASGATTAAGAGSSTTGGSGGSATTAEALAPIDQLRFLHPETLAFAAPFTLVDPDGPLGEVATTVSTATWATPDVLRSQLVNGDAEVAAVPTYVGANLSNRDVDVRMVAVVVWGLIWLLGPDGVSGDWEALRGQTVMVPFQNDMPDLVFRYLATANGLTPGEDFQIEYYAQPPEVVGRLVQGGGTWAVLPEHMATLALGQANQNGRALGRSLDLQEEWATATGMSARIPQAGIVMPGELVDERPDVVGAVLDELERTVGEVNGASPEVVAQLAQATGLDAAVIAGVIPRLNLEVVPGAEAKADLERFFTELAAASPAVIGGSLPDDGFYVADPR